MKIEVNIEKKYAFLIVGLIIVLIGVIGVYASWDNSKTVFHSANDVKVNINGQDYSLQEAINLGKISNYSSGSAQGFHVSNSELYTGNCGADTKTTCPHRWCAARGWVSGIVVEWYNTDNYVVCFR